VANGELEVAGFEANYQAADLYHIGESGGTGNRVKRIKSVRSKPCVEFRARHAAWNEISPRRPVAHFGAMQQQGRPPPNMGGQILCAL
jgi:hypothetical protein